MDIFVAQKRRLSSRNIIAWGMLTLWAGSSASTVGAPQPVIDHKPSPNQALPGRAIESPLPAPSPSPSPIPAKAIELSDTNPLLDELERITFGTAKPQMPIAERLNELELTVFAKALPQLTIHERLESLKETLLGPGTITNTTFPSSEVQQQPSQPDTKQVRSPQVPFRQEAFYQVELSHQQLEHFALELVNEERGQLGLVPLGWDELAYKVAQEHVEDLSKRDAVSHLSTSGANPDARYTQLEGADALSESLVCFSQATSIKQNRELVARVIQQMKSRQDDREMLFSPDATHFAFCLGLSQVRQRLIACAEVIAKHAIMHPIPKQVKVGHKIEVKGVMFQPYRFHKITVAWEGLTADSTEPAEPTDEAMPYFAPLDFVVYARKSEHDWEKGKAILRTAGVVAAIAGGMFIPPVALVAPVIAMAGSGGEIKAAPDIPHHGGVKVDGFVFHGSIPIDHQGQEGLYYVTVWASSPFSSKPIPVSRRTIIGKKELPELTGKQ